MTTELRELDIDLVTRGHLEQGRGGPARTSSAASSRPRRSSATWQSRCESLGGARLTRLRPALRAPLRARAPARARPGGGLDRARTCPRCCSCASHNAGRSQMAAALLDHYARGPRARPLRGQRARRGDQLRRRRVAMSELGIDVEQEFPKPMTDEVVRAADVVITMGCGDACPIYPGKRYEDWELDDPAGAGPRRRAPDPRRDRRARPPAARRAPRRLGGPVAGALAAGRAPRGSRRSRSCSPAAARSSPTPRFEGALGPVGIGLVFGLIIMVMVYATGHLSGAHINPAVTLAFTLTRHFPAARRRSPTSARSSPGRPPPRSCCSPPGPVSPPSSARRSPASALGSRAALRDRC